MFYLSLIIRKCLSTRSPVIPDFFGFTLPPAAGVSLPRPVCFIPEDWRDGTRLEYAIEWLKQRRREEAQLVPVVHGRDPRVRTATPASLAGRRVEGACGPTGASVSRTQPRRRNRPIKGNAG